MKKNALLCSLLCFVILSLCGCPNEVIGNSMTQVNQTSCYIVALYISPVESSCWGPNQLDYSIAPGSSQTFYGLSDGCYDLMIVDSSGSSEIDQFCVWGGESVTFYYQPVKNGLDGNSQGEQLPPSAIRKAIDQSVDGELK